MLSDQMRRKVRQRNPICTCTCRTVWLLEILDFVSFDLFYESLHCTNILHSSPNLLSMSAAQSSDWSLDTAEQSTARMMQSILETNQYFPRNHIKGITQVFRRSCSPHSSTPTGPCEYPRYKASNVRFRPSGSPRPLSRRSLKDGASGSIEDVATNAKSSGLPKSATVGSGLCLGKPLTDCPRSEEYHPKSHRPKCKLP